MPWPWKTVGNPNSRKTLVLRYHANLFAYLLVEPDSAGPSKVVQWGALWRGQDSPDQFAKHVRALGLVGTEALALLDLSEYQLLKVETPAVPQEELKAAARWQVKELIDAHLDDVTLDVMHVGEDQPRPNREIFVISAHNTVLRELTARCQNSGLPLKVVDIWETALRNLQSAQARVDGLAERACAAVLVHEGRCLLAICANHELYYTRRFDWDPKLTERALNKLETPGVAIEQPLGYEYMPGDDFSVAGKDHGAATEESALIIELQRSFDVWERSWPALPLARIYLALPDEQGEAVAVLMQRELGLRTSHIDFNALFTGLQASPQRQLEFAACLPLLGASLRVDARRP